MKSITLSFSFILLLTCQLMAQSIVPHSDLSGLKAFYDATNGNNWVNNKGWKNGINNAQSNPCYNWDGVTCNADNRVIKIDLRINNITGELPEEMLSIEYLEEVNFSYNNISGPIPVFFTDFEYMKKMNISSNDLEGSIPPEFSNFPSLIELILSQNNLSGSIPPEFSNFPILKKIDLRNNSLSGTIPPEIGSFANLESLVLAWNDLEGNIPSDLSNLSTLVRLTLTSNNLSGEIPPSLSDLKMLRTLDIGDNNFSGPIPAFLGDMTSLLTLSINKNNFTGELPESFSNLSKIQNLNVSENKLTGLLFDIVIKLPIIRSLRAAKNDFSGTIPKNILDKTNLNIIDLEYNNFTGKIPGAFGEQSFFNELRLNNNDFSGCINPSLFVFCGDEDINFSNNPKLPWQGNLNQYCNTSGSVVEQVGVSCNVLNLVAETITENCECLPSCEHADYIGLMSIYSGASGTGWYKRDGWKEGAAGNNCDPCAWYGVECNQDNRVTSVNLKSNNLSGSIKNQIGELTELQYLNLGGNQLNGVIPESIYALTNLKELNFGSTNFYGTISEKLGDLINLNSFSVSNSHITGPIPTTIGNLTDLEVLSLSYNDINGELPEEITNLTKLTHLTLDGNNITGSIPEAIGNLSSLKVLRMFSNKLSGSIPASLGNLDSLFILYLHNNNFSGCFDPNLLNLCDIGEKRFTENIDLPWGGEFDKFCAGSGSITEQEGAFCGLGGSGIINNCDCIKSNDLCFTQEGLLCKEWVRDLVDELDCYDYGFGQRAAFSLAVSNFKDDPVLVVFAGGEFGSEVVSTQIVYTCEGELLESCSYSLGTNCQDSLTIFSQLYPYPTRFYHCMEDTLPDDCTQSVQHPDFNAMADLFYSTNGLFWTNNEGWRQGVQDPYSNPCDGWYGVSCDDNERVISIEQENNNLVGIIPNSISELKMLQHLDLYTNKVTDVAVSSLSTLNELTFLNISDNELSGSISSDFGNFQNIKYLNLGWNKFTGNIPSEFSNLTTLTHLIFDNNQLIGGIPTGFTQLDNLESLRFSHNDLSGCIPSEYLALCFIDINTDSNPKLPWLGDLTQFCYSNGTASEQVGTPCNDSDDTNGTNDVIQEDCSCAPEIVSTTDRYQNSLSIYPNPTSDHLFITGQLENEIRYRLIDILGHTIFDAKLTSNQIQLSNVQKGIYFLEIHQLTSKRKEIFKVIKE